MLQVRLDRLGSAKRIAQMASVLGLCVEPDNLSVLCGLPEEELDRQLRTLLAAAILQWDDDGRLVFQNELLRQAVYHSMLLEDRRYAHRRVAKLLSGGEAADRALVAHHFDMAREWELAARWWLDAGEHCVWLDANREAVDHFAAGVAAAERMPEGAARDELLLRLYSRQIAPLVALHGHGSHEVCQVMTAAKGLGSASGDSYRALLDLA
jgi:predicted ATPase